MMQTEALPNGYDHLVGPRGNVDLRDRSLVLIQVPRVSLPARQARALPRGADVHFTGPSPRKVHRRLRREVRLAGRALVVLGLLVLAWSQSGALLANARNGDPKMYLPRLGRLSPTLALAPGSGSTPPGGRTIVELSAETAGAGVDSQDDPPVVLPGYLLPDDNREEPRHGRS